MLKLSNPEFRFVKVLKQSKKPFEKDWVNKPYNLAEIKGWIDEGNNYGVICGYGSLIVIDSDTVELRDAVDKKLPETFRVQTGSGGVHDYYICPDIEKKLVLKKEDKHYGEVQSFGSQVIGPGSIHPNGEEYKVIQDIEIQTIDLPTLMDCIKDFTKEFDEKEDRAIREVDEDINSIPIMNVIEGNFKKAGGEYFGSNPWHGSSSGMNFRINTGKNVAYCFRCCAGINVAQAIGLNEGIISSCDGYLDKSDFIEVLKIAEEKYGLKRSKNLVNAVSSITDKLGLARQFLEIQPVHYDRSRLWWIWTQNKWKLSDETDILNVLSRAVSANTINSKEKGEIVEALKQVGRLNIPKPAKPYWLQFKDVIYDLRTDETFKAKPEYFVTNPIPWKLGDSDDTPVMDKIFTEWVGEDNIKTLYQIIAFCSLADYPINRLFCFIGGGLNGKSKFLELIKRFVGSENTTATELDLLVNSKFEVSRLHKKLVCFMGETNFNEINRTAKLKNLTGGDTISFEYKNKDLFEDYNYATILISTNNLPTTTDKTLGFYRRWMIIDFPNRFTEAKDILEEIPKEEYENLARKIIGILKELLQERKFHNEGSVESRMERYEEKSNPLEKFIKELTIMSCDEHIPKYEFKNRLDDWCKENNFRKMTDHSIGRKMKEMGIETQKIMMNWYTKEGDRPRVNCWVGLKWQN